MEHSAQQLTVLLQDWHQGDEAAFEQLLPVVYDQLRGIAQARLRQENRFQAMTASDVLNEALIKLMGADVDWQNRQHFFAVAARTMRRVLIDQARNQLRQKRGGDATFLTLSDTLADATPESLIDLDEALTRLAVQDARKAAAVELHYFGGLTYPELAQALDVGETTIERDLRFAKAWLKKEMDQA